MLPVWTLNTAEVWPAGMAIQEGICAPTEPEPLMLNLTPTLNEGVGLMPTWPCATDPAMEIEGSLTVRTGVLLSDTCMIPGMAAKPVAVGVIVTVRRPLITVLSGTVRSNAAFVKPAGTTTQTGTVIEAGSLEASATARL